jgi:hypothetical protein
MLAHLAVGHAHADNAPTSTGCATWRSRTVQGAKMWLLVAEMVLVLVIAAAIVAWTMAGRKRPGQAPEEPAQARDRADKG